MKQKFFEIIKFYWVYLLTILIGCYLAEIATGLVMGLAQYKLSFSVQLPRLFIQLAAHPIHYYCSYLAQKNPLLLISSLITVFYSFYAAFKHHQKSQSWQTAKTDTHGSATWGSVKELRDQYHSITVSSVMASFNHTLDVKTIQTLQKHTDHLSQGERAS